MSEDTMVPSWRDIALAVGQSVAEGALLCHQKCLF